MNDAISEPLVVRDGVVSLWGYGVTIGVSRGHLVLTDGFADERRTLRLSKADRSQRITVVIESGGNVSFDAIRWLTNTETCSLVLLSRSGTVLAAIGPRRLDDTKLRRAQASPCGREPPSRSRDTFSQRRLPGRPAFSPETVLRLT